MPVSAIIRGNVTGLDEQPTSPVWSFTADKGAQVTRTFRAATFQVAMDNRPPLNAFGTGIYAGLKITDVQVKQMSGGIGELSWTMTGALTASGLPELPPDTCTVEPVKQEFAIEKHPRYKGAFTTDELAALHSALNATSENDRFDFLQALDPTGIGLGSELFYKMLDGETHYQVFLPCYKWTLNFLTDPSADSGGYPQVPFGPIAAPTGPSMGWLRESDSLQWTGSFWKLVRTWQASIDLDTDLYPIA